MEGITDVIIQSTSGMPYIAKCYESDYCKQYPDHILITGFFAALHSFKGEFQQEKLTIVGFDTLSLIIEAKQDLLVIVGIESKTRSENEKKIRKIAKEICIEFFGQYEDILGAKKTIRLSEFEKFEPWLDNKIKQASVGDILPLFRRKIGIIQKIKRKLFS